MTTLNLQNLSDAERNDAVNEAVAELDGWSHRLATHENPIERGGYKLPTTFGRSIEAWWKENDPECRGVYGFPKRYTTSSDAVMPLIEKTGFVVTVFESGVWSVEIKEETGAGETYDCKTVGEEDGPIFAFTACIAVLRAHGIEVLT